MDNLISEKNLKHFHAVDKMIKLMNESGSIYYNELCLLNDEELYKKLNKLGYVWDGNFWVREKNENFNCC